MAIACIVRCKRIARLPARLPGVATAPIASVSTAAELAATTVELPRGCKRALYLRRACRGGW
jgi:hypothetical protein